MARRLAAHLAWRRPRRARSFVALPALLMAACGGGAATPSPSPTPIPSASPIATPSASPSPSPAPAALVVWVVLQPDGSSRVRTVSTAGGAARAVATLPMDAQVLAAGSGRLAVALPDNSMEVIELDTGAATTYPTGGDALLGAAFSPDGTHLAFVAAVNPMGGRLVVLDLAARTMRTLRTFASNHYDVPMRWTADAMAGVEVVGFSDAGAQTLVRLDPTTGARTGSTGISGSGDQAISADALHAAVSRFTAGLGDGNDMPGAQHPAPWNTLQTVTIGVPPVPLLVQAHHQLRPLAVSDDGGTICYSADSSTGGFAGISQDSGFGLFLGTGSTTTQLLQWDGSTWEHAAFAGTDVVAADHTSAVEKLVRVSGAGVVSTLDSLPGSTGQAVFVAVAGVAA